MNLLSIASNLGAKGKIVYQEQPLGTAHAILCARSTLKGNVVVHLLTHFLRQILNWKKVMTE